MEANVKAVKLTGYIYFILGIVVLYLYDYGSIFAGWNPNTIGMIGLYSYLIFLISFYNNEKKQVTKIFLIIVTCLYMWLIKPTDSRSCMWFAIVAILFALSIIPQTIIIKIKKGYFWLLLVPLFIAATVVLISKTNYMKALNLWSIKKFHKLLFNGRDVLWENGFQLILKNFVFGNGSLEGNWHNCLIGIMTAYGVIGGLLWVGVLNNIIKRGTKHLNDGVILGCTISFFIMYIQQSVELGLVLESPNLLPYIVLGIMLGRANYLNK